MRNRIARVLWLTVGICGLVTVRLANATNLVSNPGFESHSALPVCDGHNESTYRLALATSWTGTPEGSSDYVHTESSTFDCNAVNPGPRSGSAHAGFGYGGVGGRAQYREFCQQELPSALIAGQTYKIEYWVHRDWGNIAATMGVLFTTYNPTTVAGNTPQISTTVNGTNGGYKLITGYFTPPGPGYRTISIGAFNTADVTDFQYFFVDDVSITSCAEFITIDQQPTSQVMTFGVDVQFSIQATGATGYRWQRLDPSPVDLDNGDDYSGTDTPTLTILGPDYCDVGIYRCNLLYECGILASQIVSLDCADAPTILSQPVDVIVNVGDPVTFTVGVYPFVPLCNGQTYAWSNDTKHFSVGNNPPYVTGANSNILHFDPTVAGQAGLYTCYITNACGVTLSRQVRLSFNKVIISQDRKYPHIVSDKDLPKIDRVMLMQNSPNPFNPETQIRFGVPREMDVTLNIYDSAGRRVRQLVTGRQHGGTWQSIAWDGRSDRGESLASGVYFYQLKAEGVIETKKMVLLK